ncbi:vitrin-like [Watersipora subatra]|uniref:vitrin-like n=1 Tax=Watersipora subatra TaxID=2589382 RepID=UPI00355B2FF6
MRTELLFSGLLVFLFVSNVEVDGSLQKLTYTRWINLLRYAHGQLQRESPSPHESHLPRAEQVETIATAIYRHFFNVVFDLVATEDGRRLLPRSFPVDFLIMLDSSASIGSENFQLALQIITTWIQVLDEENFINDALRVSMISFSEPSKVIHEFSFTSGLDKAGVIDRINSTEYHDGKSTSTVQALWMADSIFTKQSREGVTRVMLLLTDGWSHNQLALPFGVLWPSARLRLQHNVNVYVVGIGDQVNHNELESIASNPDDEHLFEVEDYSMMLEILERIESLDSLE